MKKFITGLMTIVMLVFGTAVVGAAPKSDSQNISVGIIDVDRVMSESPKVKALQDQLNQLGRELSTQLVAEKASLSSEAFSQKEEAAIQEYKRKKNELESQIDLSLNQAMDKVAKEKKISLILYKNGVARGGTDITNEVISSMQ